MYLQDMARTPDMQDLIKLAIKHEVAAMDRERAEIGAAAIKKTRADHGGTPGAAT